MRKIKDFSRFDLLSDITPTELEHFEELCEEMTYGDGDYLFREGQAAQHVNLVRSGRVCLLMNVSASKTVPLYTIEAGSIVGWSALVPECPYRTAAVAVGEVTTFRLEGGGLQRLFEEDPYLGFVLHRKLLEAVALRLTEAQRRIASLEAQQSGWEI